MANVGHRILVSMSCELWNQWRNFIPFVKVNLSRADLSEADLKGANLSMVNLSMANLRDANLSEANLRGTNLRDANLSGAYLIETNLSMANLRDANLFGANLFGANLTGTDLTGADLRGTNLSEANLTMAILSEASLSRASFREADLSGADLVMASLFNADLYQANLSGANLSRANLREANFKEANLSEADLSGADMSRTIFNSANLTQVNFSGANFSGTEALKADFTAADFTGACIEDWNINSATNLTDAICDYIYLKSGKQERRPSSGNFEPGEFTKLFQKSLETVDLIFRNGIDWDAFAYSFKKVEVENQVTQLDVQSIEKKGDSVLLIRIGVSSDTDKLKIHSDFMQGYEFAHKVLGAQYQTRINDKDKEINRLFYLVNQLSGTPKKVSNYYQQNSQFAGGIVDAETVQSQQIGGDIYNTDNQEHPD
jgi:uncharacterized protein YjbI with pentapeptide repeats